MDGKSIVKSDLGIFTQYSEETEDGRIMNFPMFQKAVKEIENRLLISRQKIKFTHSNPLDERIGQLTIDTESGQSRNIVEEDYSQYMGETRYLIQSPSSSVKKDILWNEEELNNFHNSPDNIIYPGDMDQVDPCLLQS
jgi:hypothetical protein